MASVKETLTRVLKKRFKHIENHLEGLPGNRVGGTIVSSDFSGMDHQARQQHWRQIIDELPQSDALRVGPVTLLTPEEWSVDIPAD